MRCSELLGPCWIVTQEAGRSPETYSAMRGVEMNNAKPNRTRMGEGDKVPVKCSVAIASKQCRMCCFDEDCRELLD